jgi:hypothetical protein
MNWLTRAANPVAIDVSELRKVALAGYLQDCKKKYGGDSPCPKNILLS